MGSPAIFAGQRTKLLSSKGLLLKDGTTIDNDGVVNFIRNNSGANGTTGWAEGSYTAASRPSGTFTASSGAGAFAISTTTTTPLGYGSTSFLLTKSSGASRQGRAIETSFALPLSYRAKVLQLNIDYIINSGTFVAGSNSTDSSLIWYCAFSTDGGSTYTVAEPSSFKLLSNSTTISDKFSASIQTPSDATNMKLIAYVAETANSAWVVETIVAVSPSSYVYGTPFTTPSSFVPTGSLTTSATYTGFKHQEGNFLVQKTDIAFGGTNTQGVVNINLPPGLTIDTNLLDTTSFKNVISLNGGLTIGGTTYSIAAVTNGTNNSFRIVFGNVKTDDAGIASDPTKFNSVDTSVNIPAAIASGATLSVTVRVPILGWSSSVQVSDGYDGRVIAANVQRLPTGAQSIPNNAYTAIGFDFATSDETASWVLSRTAGSSYYLVPSAGWYRVSAVAGTLSTVGSILAISPNSPTGAEYKLGVNTGSGLISGSRDIKLKAGDKVYITIYQNSGTAQNLEQYWVEASISKLSGSPTISASETVALMATNQSGQLLTSTPATITSWNTPLISTHGSFNATTGVYTFNSPGLYFVHADLTVLSSSGDVLQMYAKHTGAGATVNDYKIARTLAAGVEQLVGGMLLDVRAGDEFRLQGYSSVNRNLETASSNKLNIFKVK